MKEKDLIFLEHLDKNSRAPLGELANKLDVSKQAVSIKLKNLKESNILEYVTIIDFFKLGYSNLHLYIKIRSMNKKEYDKKINLLKNIRNITWISEFFGEYDLGISVFYKSLNQLNSLIKKIYSILGDSIEKKDMHLIRAHNFPRVVFNNKLSTEDFLKIEETNELFSLTKHQKDILNILESNSRAIFVEISEKVGLSIPSVIYNVKKLEKENIIKGYKTILNYNSLGFIWNLCIIEPSQNTNLPSLIKSLRSGCLSPFISTTIEDNIIIDFLTKDHNALKSFLNDLGANSKIKSYKILTVNKLIKIKNVFD